MYTLNGHLSKCHKLLSVKVSLFSGSVHLFGCTCMAEPYCFLSVLNSCLVNITTRANILKELYKLCSQKLPEI